MVMDLKKSIHKLILMASLGLLAGIGTRLTDFFPYNNLWSFSSIATLFGFWMFTITLVICFSSSNINAAVHVFLYLFFMNLSFYFLKYLLGFFIPRFHDEGFHWSLFLLYDIIAFVCAAISYVLYFWNNQNKLSSFLYALPVGGLVAEIIGVSFYLYHHHTFLFQLIFDSLSLLILGYWFYKKANNKLLYLITIIVASAIGYWGFYRIFI